MATESKDVELRVRAKDFSRKTLDGVTEALGNMTKAQDSQLASAKKGEVSAKALADSYTKIENSVKALIDQNALTKVFEAQANALELAKAKTDAAREAQTAYANSLADVDEKTKKQIAKQESLARAVAGADKAQLTAQTRLDKTVVRLQEYGIAVDTIGAAQQRMATGVAIGNAALERQAAALETVEADIARKITLDNTAAAEAADNAAKQVAALKAVSDAAAFAAAAVKRNNDAAIAAGQQRSAQLTAERAVTAALRASAEQADATAKGYASLARSVKSVRGNDLADQLRAINDPAAVANSNIETLGAVVDKLKAQVVAINGPVKDFRSTLVALEGTQRAVGAIGAQIDAYKRQIDTLRAARTEYVNAKIAVTELTAGLRAGGAGAADLAAKLGSAQSTLKSAATNMSAQVTATRELRTALNAAGVDTRNLGDAEAKLVAQANNATGAINSLSAAYKKHGAAAKESGDSQFSWGNGARTTLSYTQRLRGELLALATAYVGVQAAIDLGKDALKAFSTAQKIQGQLGAAFGNDAATIRKEWDYLMATANRIGISFEEAAPAYAKFAIATKAFGLAGNETRFIFERLASASRVAGLSASDFEGVLKAVEQSFSKGTVQAEELRGQLGDRLPGAFTAFAEKTGRSTAELGKAMELGIVKADEFLDFARGLPDVFKENETASNGLQAAQARYNNSLFEFKQLIADSGFADAFKQLLTELTAFFNSESGKQFAADIGSAMTGVVTVLRLVVENVGLLQEVFKILAVSVGAIGFLKLVEGGVKAIVVISDLYKIARVAVGGFTAAAVAVEAVGVGAAAAAPGVGILGVAFRALLGPIGLVILAVEAAIFAYDKLTKAKAKSMGGATGSFAPNTGGATGSWEGGPTEDPGASSSSSGRAAAAFDKESAIRQKKLDDDQKRARKKSAKDELDERADLIKVDYDMIRANAKAQIKDKQELMLRLRDVDRQEKQALTTDRIRFDAEHAKAGVAAGNKEISLKEDIKNKLLAIEADLAKDATAQDTNASFEDRKSTRIKAVADSYDKLKKTITALSAVDKKAAAEAGVTLDGYIKRRQEIEGVKVTTEEITRLEKALGDQQSLQTAELEKQKALYDAGKISQAEFLANTAEINTRADTAVGVAAKNLQAFVDAAVKANPGILSLTQQADISVKTTKGSIGTADNKKNDAANKAQEDAVANLQAKQAEADAIYKAQFDLKMIGLDEYAAKVNANGDIYKQQIIDQTAILVAQLQVQREQGLLEGTLNIERLAALDAMIAKYQLLGITTANTAKTADTLQTSINSFVSQGVDAGLNAIVDNLAKMASGQESVSEGFQNMLQSALAFFSQFMLQIAAAIAKQLILNAISGLGGSFGAAATAAGGVASASVKHSGGTVGGSGVSRPVNAAWFAGAPRLHDGGIPGLKQGEVPTILQTNEEVLSRNDPRNVLNGGGAKTQPSGDGGGGVKVVNMFDAGSFISEGLNSTVGEKSLFNHVRSNQSSWKQALGI